jgi:hypothetical protein
MPTFSGFTRAAFRARSYEGEDVLVECDDVDVIQLKPSRSFALKSRVVGGMVFRDLSRRVIDLNPGLEPVRLSRDYDLFVLLCSSWWPDPWYANAVQGWRERCKTSVCWIDELWTRDIRNLRRWLPILNKFDHVIVGITGTAEALGEALGKPCHELQGGVDTLRFSPYPKCPPRVVDFYSIGRSVQPIHQRLLKWAEEEGRFYLYDSLAKQAVNDTLGHAQHRSLYGNIAKRSRLFAVAPAKVDTPGDTHGQVAVGARYFEGAAAGAVLIGQAPDCEAFRRHFNWQDAVVEIRPDGSDAVEVISKLLADSERLRAIGSRNAVESLRRHDWVYRWKEVLRIAGLAPRPAMAAREERLAELAEAAAGHAN